MIALPTSTHIYLACGSTDMRRGFDGLALMVQEVLQQDPHSGAVFAFRGKRGDLIKLLWWDTQGLCLFCKRMDKGKFIWPMAATGSVSLTPAQLSMLLEGIDWRAHPSEVGGRLWLAESTRHSAKLACAMLNDLRAGKRSSHY